MSSRDMLAAMSVAAKPLGGSPPLRVFRHRDDAYQAERDADIAVTPDGATVVLRTVDPMAHRGATYATAAPLSTWREWFRLTLRKAAHDYLDVAIELGAEYLDSRLAMTDDALMCRSVHADAAAEHVARICAFGSIAEYHREPTERIPHLDRVLADIEARLRGEPGEAVRP